MKVPFWGTPPDEPRERPPFDLTATSMTLDLADQPNNTIAWFVAHGQRVLGCGAWVPGGLGVVWQSAEEEPVQMAIMGDTVVYDNETGMVTVA